MRLARDKGSAERGVPKTVGEGMKVGQRNARPRKGGDTWMAYALGCNHRPNASSCLGQGVKDIDWGGLILWSHQHAYVCETQRLRQRQRDAKQHLNDAGHGNPPTLGATSINLSTARTPPHQDNS